MIPIEAMSICRIIITSNSLDVSLTLDTVSSVDIVSVKSVLFTTDMITFKSYAWLTNLLPEIKYPGYLTIASVLISVIQMNRFE